MKKTIFVIAILTALFSCSKSDSDNPKKEEQITRTTKAMDLQYFNSLIGSDSATVVSNLHKAYLDTSTNEAKSYYLKVLDKNFPNANYMLYFNTSDGKTISNIYLGLFNNTYFTDLERAKMALSLADSTYNFRGQIDLSGFVSSFGKISKAVSTISAAKTYYLNDNSEFYIMYLYWNRSDISNMVVDDPFQNLIGWYGSKGKISTSMTTKVADKFRKITLFK